MGFLTLSLGLSNVADLPTVIFLYHMAGVQVSVVMTSTIQRSSWLQGVREGGSLPTPPSPEHHLQVAVSDRLVLVIVNE